MKKFEEFLSAAWDWSRKNEVPVELKRGDINDDWYVSIVLKDARGQFNGILVAFEPLGTRQETIDGVLTKLPPETDAEFYARIKSKLSQSVAHARSARIKEFTKTSAYGRAA
jgi:hypothetical protein